MKTILVVLLVLTAAFTFAGSTTGAEPVAEDDADRPAGFQAEDSPRAEEHETLDSFFNLYQPYLTNISAYEPIYFLVGTNPSKSKFQISFKYRLLNPDGPLAQEHSWVKGFHFGYTQTSFWDLESDSMPFDDTSYKPELFHITSNSQNRPSWLEGLFYKTGVRHESNGRAQELSRSLNYVYFQPIFIFYKKKTKLGMSVSPKFWAYFNKGDNTTHIEDYRGYFELDVKLGKADSLVLGTDFRWAKEGGSILLDLTYPIRALFENLNIYLHVQYANGLAESLLHYDERTEALRIGLSFVR